MRTVSSAILFALCSSVPALAQTPRLEPLRSAYPIPGARVLGADDLTGDGRPDLLLDGGPVLHAGVSDGLFERVGSPVGVFGVAFDVDADTDLDLLSTNALYRNQGDGTFVDASGNVPTCSSCSSAFGDLNGDGHVDLIQNPFGSGRNRILINDGTGNFVQTAGLFPNSFTTAGTLLVLDVDGDLDQDVLSQASGGQFLLWTNQGGSFTNAGGTGIFFTLFAVIPSFDFDADGDLDLLVPEGANGRFWVNDGVGGFTSGPAHPFAPVRTARLDADGDGWTDFAGWTLSASSVLHRSNGDGTFTPVPGAIPDGFVAKFVRDLDGDGDTDLIGEVEHHGYTLALNDGTGRFFDVSYFGPQLPGRTDALAILDFEGGPALEALACIDGALVVERDPGTLSAEARSRWLPNRTTCDEVTLFDADGDGPDDVLLEGDGRAVVLTRAAGKRRARVPFSLGGNAQARVLADGDADGDADLFVLTQARSTSIPATLALFENDGNGDFEERTRLTPPNPRGMVAADLDGDGDADPIVLQSNRPELFVNDGAGGLHVASGRFPTSGPGDRQLTEPVLLDLEGDGDLDLVAWDAIEVDALHAYENDGLGVFAYAPGVFSTTVFGRPALFAVDLDGDGDEDLVSEGGDLWENQGAGTFVETPAAIPGFLLPGSFADLDRDGDLDAYAASPRRVLTNLETQLALRAVPRIGEELTLDVYGPPGTPWMLLSSSTRGPGVPTAMGLSYLEGSLATQGSGTLDGNGEAHVTLLIPDSISLVGSRLYWQASVGTPARLTNLEETTLTDL